MIRHPWRSLGYQPLCPDTQELTDTICICCEDRSKQRGSDVSSKAVLGPPFAVRRVGNVRVHLPSLSAVDYGVPGHSLPDQP